ncbi:MAG: TIGR03915 family putative DNA repair protein [Christensenellaceae bacterium]|jgi:probable DNA metabolism protein
MSARRDVTYRYDGSFEGFLCCVFRSYQMGENPEDIFPPGTDQLSFFDYVEIVTDEGYAQRVLRSIPPKMGKDALDFIKRAFLTSLPKKEWYMLRFLQLGYRHGPRVMRMLTDDSVNALFKAVNHLTNEAHLLTGFVRFSVCGGALVSIIDPKNYVLPILRPHFAERYPNERFLIYDRTHKMALVHDGGKTGIGPLEDFHMPSPDAEEETFRELWKLFYDTIAVPGRENPRCRRSHMPERYWHNMTEFNWHKKRNQNHPESLPALSAAHLPCSPIGPASGQK